MARFFGKKRKKEGEWIGQILDGAGEEDLLEISAIQSKVQMTVPNHERLVQLVIDKDILEAEYLGCHPCINTSSLRVAMKDILEKFLPYVEHDYLVVDL